MKYFLGVDVGGTKTHALIADENGRLMGFGTGGAGNWQNVGYEKMRDVIEDAIRGALNSASLKLEQISAAAFGIAGYDWPSEVAAHQHMLDTLGLACPIEMTNDSIIALLAGSGQGWGIVLISGTGNNCRGRDRHGYEGRITGEGILFGEYGGGEEIVLRAIQAVAYEWSRRGPQTQLSQRFIQRAGARDLFDLIEGIDMQRYQPDASWAPIVFDAARSGDVVAREVVNWSARELGESACAVIRQLGLEEDVFDVVLAGSVFEAGEIFAGPLRETIQRVAPGARFVRLDVPPVTGAVWLAMRSAGLEHVNIYDNLIQSTKALT
jgi:N-acetylglucosamine kinase-like BadF-type ATPase